MLAYQNVKRNKGSVCMKEKEILEVQRNIFVEEKKLNRKTEKKMYPKFYWAKLPMMPLQYKARSARK